MNDKDSGHTRTCTTTNAHLKGRKRFIADLRDIEEECKVNFCHYGLCLTKLQRGDEEGSFEVTIENETSQHVLSVNLLVLDTAEYPNSHPLFCYSSEGDIPANIQRVIEEFSNEPSRSVRETLLRLLSSLGQVLGISVAQSSAESMDYAADLSGDETEYMGESDDDYAMLSDDDVYDIGGSFAEASPAHCDMAALQRDFLETIAADYRPGYIKHSSENFCITISIPILRLTEIIPPQALMAWDRSLLSKTQHLCLLISGFCGVYPVLTPDGKYTNTAMKTGVKLQFNLGLTQRYKPGKENAQSVVRKHGLLLGEPEKEVSQEASDLTEQLLQLEPPLSIKDDEPNPNEFNNFSLSSSMEAHMNQSFLKLVQFRRQFGLNWGGAEKLLIEVEASQNTPEEVMRKYYDDIMGADTSDLEVVNKIPFPDPLHGLAKETAVNLPLAAFYYLVRRLSICPQYCLVCHRKLNSTYKALKPYVCDSKLCAYQYYALNRGAPLEYEIIHNPYTVDLLVSFTYTAAVGGVLEEPPVGMALRVPRPRIGFDGKKGSKTSAAETADSAQSIEEVVTDEDGLCDFDELPLPQMRAAIVAMLDSLPSIYEMRKHLTQKVSAARVRPKLQDINPQVLPAAWLVLRWCVASCTAYLEEITDKNELVDGLGPSWRQFRFSVDSPDSEAKFKQAVEEAQKEDERARSHPILYAFHGSPLRNWHSIIRHGLWFKTIANGRAYGHGVYLARDGQVSTGQYAASGQCWSKSMVAASKCAALVEIVNLPHKFVSYNPFFVVNKTHWLLCRYLLVQGRETESQGKPDSTIPFVELDPRYPTTMNRTQINIPEPSHKITTLLDALRAAQFDEDHDEDDQLVFTHVPEPAQPRARLPSPTPVVKTKVSAEDDWIHDRAYVRAAAENLLPPPDDSSTTATMALQRELRAAFREQRSAASLKELGWYLPTEFNEDNLFQWIVEMHSFDPEIPIAKDLTAKKLNSIIFEIRFPPTFPHSPPFFRILTPRFLPFIRGGGGHVTGGGSICMDLLTADGWSPSYSIPAVLMQIRLAISNLEPRPARLDPSSWDTPYQSREALEGYIRAANAHGWRVPEGLKKLLYC